MWGSVCTEDEMMNDGCDAVKFRILRKWYYIVDGGAVVVVVVLELDVVGVGSI